MAHSENTKHLAALFYVLPNCDSYILVYMLNILTTIFCLSRE